MKKVTPRQAMAILEELKFAVKHGANYYEAEKASRPLVNIINQRSKELAKEHGVKPRLISFQSYVR